MKRPVFSPKQLLMRKHGAKRGGRMPARRTILTNTMQHLKRYPESSGQIDQVFGAFRPAVPKANAGVSLFSHLLYF